MHPLKYVLCASSAVLLLTGCGGSGSGGSSSDANPGAPRSVSQGKAAGAAGERAGGSSVGGGAAGGGLDVASSDDRSVVYTASLRVRAADVPGAATKAKRLVTGAGGHVGNETGSSEPVNARLVLMVPGDRYAGVLEQLSSGLGTRLSLQQDAEDVTEQVADVDSRVKSAQAALQTFRKLLGRANTIGEVLNVEQEITRREADLEALQARQKSLARQTRYATVTLQIEAPAERSSGPGGFVGGLESGWHAFVVVLSAASVLFGALLPFATAAAVIGVPVWLLLRRYRRVTAPGGRPAPPAPPVQD